ncbi:MAG TPA: hypothetical protein VI488_18185 [Candidatus Angelobacter sp.]
MPIFRVLCNKNICLLLVLCVFCATTGFSQPSANCPALKQRYSEAIQNRNSAASNRLGQQLNAQGCHGQPKISPAPSAVQYRVGNVQTVAFGNSSPGEAQSTVIPPGANTACPAGVLLISDDWLRPPSSIVRGRHLSGNKPDIVSTFDSPPHPENYSYVTNDHDLIALADGSVLYLTGAGTKEPLKKKPAWWDVAYSGKFGPGARGNLMVWRSTDCGANFHYLAQMDPAVMEDGSCANPQLPLDSSGHYAMGGSDGQLVKLDPSDGTLYLTFRCVGYEGGPDKKGDFKLTNTWLNKTLVARSTDSGVSWQSMGFIDGVDWWRFGILPMGKRVAFAFSNDIIFADVGGKVDFERAQPLVGKYGSIAQTTSFFNPNPSPDPYIFANVWGNTVIARAGESQGMVFAFPTIIKDGKTRSNGYSVFFHDPLDSGAHSEIKAILPVNDSPQNYVMDVSAIDLGSGPVLLYWADVNTASHKARIRGRVISALGTYSNDFDITGDTDLTVAASGYYPKSPQFFYGDYHTGSGYMQQRGPVLTRKDIYHFYPLWVDRTGGARYSVVTVSENAPLVAGVQPALPLQYITVPPEEWTYPQPVVELNTFRGNLPQMRETIHMLPK